MKYIYLLTIAGILTFFSITSCSQESEAALNAGEIYDIEVETIDGELIKLSEYKNKVILIVNVASKCGFTPQYKGLQALYEKYKKRGFEILAFPCNQFGGQEPGTHEEIKEFCSTNFNVTFPLFGKLDVNGENAHPLYKYLTAINGETVPIKWNFTKFLFGPNGEFLGRFETRTTPEQLEKEIVKAFGRD